MLVWKSSDQVADLISCHGSVATCWELVQNDTGIGFQMQEGSFVLAWQVLPQQSAAELELEILVDLGQHSSDKLVGHSMEKLKSLQQLPVAVGDLVIGSSEQHFETYLGLKYLLKVGLVAHLEVHS